MLDILSSFEVSGIDLTSDHFDEHPMPETVKNVYFHALQNEVISLECLERLTELESLTITKSKAKEVDLSSLDVLPELRSVNISLLEKLERIDLSPLVSMSNLESLFLSRINLQVKEVRGLSTHQTLKFLEMSMVDIKDLDLSALSGSPKLAKLILYGNNVRPSIVSLPDDCPVLEKIWLNYTWAKTIELKNWESLTWLDLSTNHIHTLDFEPLRSSSKLEHIFISENFIQELDVSPLFACPNLRGFICDEDIKLHTNIDGVPPEALLNPTYVKRGKRRRIHKTSSRW